MGKPIRRVSRSIVDDFHHDRDDTAKAVQQLRNQKNPTIPHYDSTNFPDDPTYGQLVTDEQDPSVIWVYGHDNQWHKIGGTSNNLFFSPNQVIPLFDQDPNGVFFPSNSFWTPVQDSACYSNARLMTADNLGIESATINPNWIGFRFGLGPTGSIWIFNIRYVTGPDYGIITGYLGKPHETSTPNSGATTYPGGELDQISNGVNTDPTIDGFLFDYIKAFKIECNNATVTKNNIVNVGFHGLGNYYSTTSFRVLGNASDEWTGQSPLVDPDLGEAVVWGGPGIYYLLLKIEETTSGGYRAGLQSISATRVDWAWA